MSDQPMAAQACEHYWAYHCYGGLSVRLCMICHEPDWDDVRRSRGEAERIGRALERADIIRTAVERRATWNEPCDDRSDHADGPHSHPLPFADLLAELPPDWPGSAL